MPWRGYLAVFVLALTVVAPIRAPADGCAADCNEDGIVGIGELIVAVNIVLGLLQPSACAQADSDSNGFVTIDDLIRGVRAALEGCVLIPTPTQSPRPSATPTATRYWRFTDVTAEAIPRLVAECTQTRALVGGLQVGGGAAAGDYDGDGWVDLFVTLGERNAPVLLHNRNGRFRDVTEDAGATLPDDCWSSAILVDFDGDADRDLFVGALVEPGRAVMPGVSTITVLRNDRGRFFTHDAGISGYYNTYSLAFSDVDADGDLDFVRSMWGTTQRLIAEPIEHLWLNAGNGLYRPSGGLFPSLAETAIRPDCEPHCIGLWSFTPNFADLNGDGLPDLLWAADFGTSRVLLNRGGGRFEDVTTPVISDENGMGATVADYDNDGHFDWFVTSIRHHAPGRECDAGPSGNRLYRNRGDGSFEDVTAEAGVRDGGWGWGACAADFNNDGWIDLYHVNGWPFCEGLGFGDDPAVLFLSNGDGTFREIAADVGVNDRGQGRGVVCFDYDRDGDIDIFVGKLNEPARLFRNDGGNSAAYLEVSLRGRAPNTEGIGARVELVAGGKLQAREIRAGSNYLSHDPAVAHFGLGNAERVDEIRVRWPDGTVTLLSEVRVNQRLSIRQEE